MNQSWIRSAGPTVLHPVMTLSIGLAMILQRGSSITTITTPSKFSQYLTAATWWTRLDPLRYSIFMNIFLLMLMLHMKLASGSHSLPDTSHAMSSEKPCFFRRFGDHWRCTKDRLWMVGIWSHLGQCRWLVGEVWNRGDLSLVQLLVGVWFSMLGL